MIEKSVAPAMPERTLPESRASRALKLYVDRFEEIAASYRDGVYKVPSCTGAATYTVRLGRRGDYCSCPDFKDGECTCVMVVKVVRKVTAPCASCGARFRYRHLTEVHDDHESLTWFPGDRLCAPCLDAAGGIA